MAYPAPTSEYLDLTVSPFTANGSPTPINGFCGGATTYDFDGSNDYLTSTVKPFSASSGAVHSFAFWIKYAQRAANDQFVTQRDTTSGNSAFYIYSDSSGFLQCSFYNSSSNRIVSEIVAGHKDWDDGNWRRMGIRVSGDDLDILIDGVEASSYGDENNVVGSGFSGGLPSTVDTLAIGATGNGLAPAQGPIDAVRFWEGTAMTDAQFLEEFNDAAACFASTSVVSSNFDFSLYD